MNKSKRKGSDAEVKLLAWLKDHGHRARRNPPAGKYDVGDLAVEMPYYLPNGSRASAEVVIEVKNWEDQTAAINQGLAELDVEMVNAGTSHGVLVVKRRGKGDPGEWLAIRRVENDPEIGS